MADQKLAPTRRTGRPLASAAGRRATLVVLQDSAVSLDRLRRRRGNFALARQPASASSRGYSPTVSARKTANVRRRETAGVNFSRLKIKISFPRWPPTAAPACQNVPSLQTQHASYLIICHTVPQRAMSSGRYATVRVTAGRARRVHSPLSCTWAPGDESPGGDSPQGEHDRWAVRRPRRPVCPTKCRRTARVRSPRRTAGAASLGAAGGRWDASSDGRRLSARRGFDEPLFLTGLHPTVYGRAARSRICITAAPHTARTA
jgi:hypothetical protein